MSQVLQRPWVIPLAVFIAASGYFLSMAATFPTFFNANSDSALFLIAAKFLRIGHPSPGYPLYTLINAGWLYITPFWSDVFSLTFLNVLFSGAVAGVLYLITRTVMAPLLWMSAGIVVSQSTILEQYSLMILFMIVSYYFYRQDKRSLAYAIASFGIMVNHQAGFCIIAYLANDIYRHNSLKPFLWSFISLPLLAYIPLANRPPFLMIDGDSPRNYINYFLGQRGLIMGLSIIPTDDLITRSWETVRLVLGGLGISVILIFYGIKNTIKDSIVLPILFFLPLLYYFGMLSSWAYTYTLPIIAFGIILACQYEWKFIRNACIAGSIVLIAMNFMWYDFGRTLDEERTNVQFLETLEELPSDAVVISNKGFLTPLWIMLHNLENDTEIKNLSWDLLGEYATNTKDWNPDLDILIDAEKDGRLYEYSLIDAKTLEVQLKQLDKNDKEYTDFVKWLESPITARLDCELRERQWTC